MPQVNGDQSRVAQALTSWFNTLDLDETSRTAALCTAPWLDLVAQWVDATGASTTDLDTAAELIVDGVIEIEDGQFLRTQAGA